jgi:hypothetical protein
MILRAPFGWRPLRIPYTHVGGVQPRDRRTRLGFVYYVPRPAFEGAADPRPPRVQAALTAPLADLPTALADLNARLAVHPPDGTACPRLSADQTNAYLQRRRLRRTALIAGLTLALPAILIGLLRLGFDVYRALAYGFTRAKAPFYGSFHSSGLDHPQEQQITTRNLIGQRIDVLDKGWIELQDLMGDDLAIVNAARASFLGESKGPEKDKKLLFYLMEHRHTTPFEMVEFKFRVRAHW